MSGKIYYFIFIILFYYYFIFILLLFIILFLLFYLSNNNFAKCVKNKIGNINIIHITYQHFGFRDTNGNYVDDSILISSSIRFLNDDIPNTSTAEAAAAGT